MEIRRNVLLADANEEFRTMLREEIEKSESFAVVGSTGNGVEALELAGKRGDTDFIAAHHAAMMEAYEALCAQLDAL